MDLTLFKKDTVARAVIWFSRIEQYHCLGINVNEFVVNKRLIKQKDLCASQNPKEPFISIIVVSSSVRA